MKTNDIEEFIDYVCSTGATPETDLFTREQILKIGKATRCSDVIVEKTIRKEYSKSFKEENERND